MIKITFPFLMLLIGQCLFAQTIPTYTKPKTTKPKSSAPKPKPAVVKTKIIYLDRPSQEKIEPKSNAFYFFDDFTDNKNEWNLPTNENNEVIIANGKLVIKGINDYTHESHKEFNVDTYKDFSCSVILKWIEGVENQSLGIKYCSNLTTLSDNVFVISTNGYYQILSFENGAWKNIKDWTSSAIINKVAIPNILKIVKNGNFISFIINDSEVEKFPFDGGFGTAFGVSIGGKQTVQFDNFELIGTKK